MNPKSSEDSTPRSAAPGLLEGDAPRTAPGGAPGLEPELGDLLAPRDPAAMWKRALLLTGAGCCFVLGVVGWLVPVVTGLPFYVAALILLAGASDRVRVWINARERRLPLAARRKLRSALARFHPKR